MNETILTIIQLILAFIAGYYFKKREYQHFIIERDNTGKVAVRPVVTSTLPSGKAIFIEEPTQEDIEELEKPPKLKKFLDKFKKVKE